MGYWPGMVKPDTPQRPRRWRWGYQLADPPTGNARRQHRASTPVNLDGNIGNPEVGNAANANAARRIPARRIPANW